MCDYGAFGSANSPGTELLGSIVRPVTVDYAVGSSDERDCGGGDY